MAVLEAMPTAREDGSRRLPGRVTSKQDALAMGVYGRRSIKPGSGKERLIAHGTGDRGNRNKVGCIELTGG